MPLEFNEIRPLLEHMLATSRTVKIFLTRLTEDAHVSIPTLPQIHCDAVFVTVTTMDELATYFNLSRNNIATVRSLHAFGPQCVLKLNCVKRKASLHTANEYIAHEYCGLISCIHGLELRIR